MNTNITKVYTTPSMEFVDANAQSVICSSGSLQQYQSGSTQGWF